LTTGGVGSQLGQNQQSTLSKRETISPYQKLIASFQAKAHLDIFAVVESAVKPVVPKAGPQL
jgi:hypothetical protein